MAEHVLDRPDLAQDPQLSLRDGRLARRDELFAILDEAFAKQPWSYWQERMRAAQVPCGEVRSVSQAIRSPEARARPFVTRIAHPLVGEIPNFASPIRYQRTPLADPVAAPSIGQHSDEVLREVLGLTSERIQAMAQAGAFGKRLKPEGRA